MNRTVMDYLTKKMHEEDGRRRRNRRTGRYMRDGETSRYVHEDHLDRRDYADRTMDGRYEDERDYRRDYGESIELSKSDMQEWKRMLVNADGSKGAHYDMHQIIQAAERIGVKFHEFDEKEFCMTVNMLYSDYCQIVNKFIPHDKSLTFFAEMAKAFLEDEDAPEGSEKLALYYHCIVCNEEV